MTSILPHWLRPSLLFFLYIFAIPPGWLGRIRKPVHSKALNTFNFKNFIHIQLINSTFTVQIPNCNPWILMKPSLSLSISSKFNQLLSNEAFSQLLCSIIQPCFKIVGTFQSIQWSKRSSRITMSLSIYYTLEQNERVIIVWGSSEMTSKIKQTGQSIPKRPKCATIKEQCITNQWIKQDPPNKTKWGNSKFLKKQQN